MANYFILGDVVANRTLQPSYLNQMNDDFDVFSTHNHSGSTGQGASNIQLSASPKYAPRYETFFLNIDDLTDGFLATCTGLMTRFVAESNGPSPLWGTACTLGPMYLIGGTYLVEVMVARRVFDGGIASMRYQKDDGPQTTIMEVDCLTGGSAIKVVSTSLSLTTAEYTVNFTASGKKSGGSGSIITLIGYKFRRTGP